jgi:hypothetical protein
MYHIRTCLSCEDGATRQTGKQGRHFANAAPSANSKSDGQPNVGVQLKIPCSKLQGIFDRKEYGLFMIRSLTPPQAAGRALAFAVQKHAFCT